MMRVVTLRRRGARRRVRRILRAFSQGRIAKEEAVRKLGLRDYAGLLIALGRDARSRRGWRKRPSPLPVLPEKEIRDMTENFLRLWRASKC